MASSFLYIFHHVIIFQSYLMYTVMNTFCYTLATIFVLLLVLRFILYIIIIIAIIHKLALNCTLKVCSSVT